MFSVFGLFDSNGLMAHAVQNKNHAAQMPPRVELVQLPGTPHWVPKDSPLLQMSVQQYAEFRNTVLLHSTNPADRRRMIA